MRNRWAVVGLMAVLSACATPGFASRYLVDPSGGGDFTTIQAAIDQRAIEFRDTILVMPGEYNETLVLAPVPLQAYIVGAAGPSGTVVLSITPPADRSGDRTCLEGLTFAQDVLLEGNAICEVRFAHCAFRGRTNAGEMFIDACGLSFTDCDFYGRTRLDGLDGHVRGLRFHGAPLTVTHSTAGSFYMEDCTFEGPADTLVYTPWSNTADYGNFTRCSFANAVNGIIYGADCSGPLWVDRCRFLDLSGVAISRDAPGDGSTIPYEARFSVANSRFERCGTAVRWVIQQPNFTGSNWCLRDTILDCTGDGIVYGPGSMLWVKDCIVSGCGGHGIVATQTPAPNDLARQISFNSVTGSRLTNNGGDGLRIVDQDSISGAVGLADNWGPQTVDSCLFANNGGAGLRLLAPKWKVTDCVAIGNGGDGFDLGYVEGALLNEAHSNTSVFNLGVGIRVTSGGPQGDSATVLRRNLAAMNGREGFRVPHHSFGSLAFNDAWGNYLTQYVGAWASLDSNLTVDPRFCDLGAGDLGLQQGSPCGPSGVYGLIGALPETCPSTLTVEPSTASAPVFAVRPSIARGSAEFVPPVTGEEGVVELFDLAGRVVWRTPLGPATGVVRWRGEGESGHVRAGLYWARFTRGSERASQRLVWLE